MDVKLYWRFRSILALKKLV